MFRSVSPAAIFLVVLHAFFACSAEPVDAASADSEVRGADDENERDATAVTSIDEAPRWEGQLLSAPPLVCRPTATSVAISLVGGLQHVDAELVVTGREPIEVSLPPRRTEIVAINGLEPGQMYEYELRVSDGRNGERHSGRFVTARPPGESFRFALFSDPHLPVADPRWFQSEEYLDQVAAFHLFHEEVGATFRTAMEVIRGQQADFVVCLGDMLHLPFGFNAAFGVASAPEMAYLDFRRHLGRMGSEASFFTTIGNWEGESGWHDRAARRHARRARMKLVPNPEPDTYRFGGGEHQDYYAFEWGDAFLCVLNVMSYTKTRHTMRPRDKGTAEDWTLGEAQFTWFERVLQETRQPYKFVLIHHTVGGNGGDEENSAYGRGGGRAARIGEQERVHELLVKEGVQVFFYGHDHVFTDMVVDGVHYTLPGSAGAPWKFPVEETGYERYDERSGFATVEVGPKHAAVEFRDLTGEVFERFEVDPKVDER